MKKYQCTLTNQDDADSFSLVIQAGTHLLTFDFQWAIVSQEQYDLVMSYLNKRANSEPLAYSDGNFVRDYDWYTYYGAIYDYLRVYGNTLSGYLDTNPILPAFIKNLPRENQLTLLRQKLDDYEALLPVMKIYENSLVWQFTMEGENLNQTVGVIRPGGWYNNQDNVLSFRFVSSLENVGRDDIGTVTIEFEVKDE